MSSHWLHMFTQPLDWVRRVCLPENIAETQLPWCQLWQSSIPPTGVESQLIATRVKLHSHCLYDTAFAAQYRIFMCIASGSSHFAVFCKSCALKSIEMRYWQICGHRDECCLSGQHLTMDVVVNGTVYFLNRPLWICQWQPDTQYCILNMFHTKARH